MKRFVFCFKLRKKKEGLNYYPFLGNLGEIIYNNISKKIWLHWIKYQTSLINEYNLTLNKNKDRIFLYNKMKKFLFNI